MTPPTTSFAIDRHGTFSLTYQSVEGRGHVYPRIAFSIQARFVPQGLNPQPTEVDIRRLIADVTVGTEMIGRGESLGTGNPVSIHNDGSLQVEIPVSPPAIQHVDEAARGQDVHMRLALRGDVRYRRRAEVSPQGGLVEAPGPWEDWTGGMSGLDIDIPRSTWVKDVLQPIGTNRYIWMELPLPPPPASKVWEAVEEHLRLAEARNHEGNDPDVLRYCHDALQAVSPSNPKGILPAIADDAKRQQLDEALHHFRDFLQNGRHPQKTGANAGRYDVDHRDAQFALATTKVWLVYVARLLADT